MANRLTGFWQPLRHGKVMDEGRVNQVFPPSFDPPASPPEMLLGYMDQAGVDRAFLVQHHLYGDQNVTVLDAVKRWPGRMVGFAYLGAFDQPDGPDQLERLVAAGMLGLKLELASTRRLRPDFRFDGELEWRIWERLNQLGRPLILDLNVATADDVAAIRTMIREFERVRIVVCHVGGPPREGWEVRASLAEHPNVWIDAASMPAMVDPGEDYPYPAAQQILRWAVSRFGSAKVMLGTDFPSMLSYGTYRQLFDYVGRRCDLLTPREKLDILGGTAERFLDSINAM